MGVSGIIKNITILEKGAMFSTFSVKSVDKSSTIVVYFLDMDLKKDEYESLGRIPKSWYFTFATCFAFAVILNGLVDFFSDWHYAELGETFLTRSVNLMALVVGLFFIAAHLWEIIKMLFYHSNLIKQRILEEGRQEGRQEATQELLSELMALVEKNGDAGIKAFIEAHQSETADDE